MRASAVCALALVCVSPVLLPAGARAGAEEPVTPCDVRAYVNDPDPNGMNVRSGPGSTYKVVGNLPDQQADGIEVHITGSRGDWVRIDSAEEQGGERKFFRGEGWVYAPLLGVDGMGGFDPPGTPLYASARKGRVVARLPVENGGARVRGCRGRWTEIEYKGRRYWGAPQTLCYLAITNCN